MFTREDRVGFWQVCAGGGCVSVLAALKVEYTCINGEGGEERGYCDV